MDNEALAKLKKAKLGLSFTDPFLATITLSVQYKEDKNAGTAYTDGEIIGYSPEFVKELSKDNLMFVLAHEALHIILGHCLRREQLNADANVWNIAADMVVNRTLIQKNVGAPFKGIIECPHEFNEDTTEQIYEKLMKDPKMRDKCLSLGGNNPLQGDIHKLSSTQSEAQEVLKEIMSKAKNLGGAEDYGGPMGEELRSLMEVLFNPKIPWRKLLRNFCSELIKSDYSWARPNRRFTNMYLPSLSAMSPALKTANIYIDVSGSIDNDTVKQFTDEMFYLKKTYNLSNMTIQSFSTELADKTVIEKKSDIPKSFHSTGGTDIAPVIEDIIQTKARINIIFTDGYFDQDPIGMLKQNVFWIIYDNPDYIPSKGKVAHL